MIKEFLKTTKKPFNFGLICGGRTAGRTYAQFLRIYEEAKLKGYDEITIRFFEPETVTLQQRIDKAIKYIENNSPYMSNSELYDLLEILKGESNE